MKDLVIKSMKIGNLESLKTGLIFMERDLMKDLHCQLIV